MNEFKNFLSFGKNPLIENIIKIMISSFTEKIFLISEFGLSEIFISIDFLIQ